jgi:hypothetical protein
MILIFVVQLYLILVYICCFVKTMHRNKRLFTHLSPVTHVHVLLYGEEKQMFTC